MQSEDKIGKEKETLSERLGNCERHSSEMVRFLCISPDVCPKNNLLCTECIDCSGRDHSHQLISVRRFHSFLSTYSGQALNYTKRAQEVTFPLSRRSATCGRKSTSRSKAWSTCRHASWTWEWKTLFPTRLFSGTSSKSWPQRIFGQGYIKKFKNKKIWILK